MKTVFVTITARIEVSIEDHESEARIDDVVCAAQMDLIADLQNHTQLTNMTTTFDWEGKPTLEDRLRREENLRKRSVHANRSYRLVEPIRMQRKSPAKDE